MATNSYSFNLGNFKCLIVKDGTFINMSDKIFSNVQAPELDKMLAKYDLSQGEIVTPISCLVVKDNNKTILIDTGWGIGIQPEAGKLLQNLLIEGIKPEDIDVVVLSHAHPDHIGGMTDITGKLTFSRAKFVLDKNEAEFWMSEPDLSRVAADDKVKTGMLNAVRKNLLPFRDRLVLVDKDVNPVPGISFMKTPGHTPEHCAIIISSAGNSLICMADLLIYPLQLEKPEWFPVFDFMPELSSISRKQTISRVIQEKMLVFACHFPFPGIGKIIRDGTSCHWQPVNDNLD